MKRYSYILIALLFGNLCAFAQDYQQAFNEVQLLFEQRIPTTIDALKDYVEEYPYTVYEDEVHTMLGVLYTEKEQYKRAIKSFGKVRVKNLARATEPMYHFYLGYAHIQMEDYQRGLQSMLKIKDKHSAYALHARYYAGYCYYTQADYQRALVEFLTLEQLGGYDQVAPYYVVQIYYAQGEYDKVYQRAEQLLAKYPTNPYNDELHRMLGEMYYTDSVYTDAVRHLEAYYELRQTAQKEILRNDMYLLGLSHYMTHNYQEAVNHLKTIALEQDTISENTCLHLGHAYLRLQDIENAKLSYAAAIRYNINPTVREEAMYNYVQVSYLQNSALGESIIAFQDFIRDYPNSKYINKVYALMADLYMTSKNYRAALTALETISNADKKILDTKQYLRYQLAVDAFVQGKMTEVIEWSNKVITNAKQPSTYKTEAYYLAAQAHYALHQYPQTVEQINLYNQQPNVNASENKAMATYLKAYALFNQKNYVAAEPVFKAFIATQPATNLHADALNRVADCLFHARQFAPAIELYTQVANLKSTGADYALLQNGYAQGLLHQYPQKVLSLNNLIEQYPQSDYADDALYEMARAQLLQHHNQEAIQAYQSLLQHYPNSNRAVKASLEMGMTYRTLKQYDLAIQSFKTTIEKYSATEEAYAALEGLEQVYVETNNIEEYINYTKQLSKINMQTASSEDSLVYVTAELQYMLGNYPQAAAGLTTYLTRFCPGGRYCTNATYYAARSYYQLKQYDEAIEQYSSLADIQGNPYMEEACMRVAELSFDKQEYQTARYYFQRMSQVASSSAMRHTAMLGILRSSQKIGDNAQIIDAADRLLDQKKITEEVRTEALYARAKAQLDNQQYGLAVVDFTPVAKEVRTVWGAESKYQIAYCYFQLGSLDLAEQEIMAFTQMQTSHQYWLAKALILLSDINVERNELFQAKQYLLALQSNYKSQDDIPMIISDKLQHIAQLEQQTQQPTTELQEEAL